MKITLPLEDLDEALQTIGEGELADDFLNNAYFALDPKELSLIGKTIEKGSKPSDAFRAFLLSQLDEEAKELFAEIQVGFGLEDIHPLNPLTFVLDPYYARVATSFDEEKTHGSWTLKRERYLPYQPFVYDEVRESELVEGARYSPIAYFEAGFPYPALSQNGRVYMSLIPHEINTMAEPVFSAQGHVCTMGLGMGYFAFMASQKEEVEKVTVLERDEEAIALFRDLFLPLFDHPEKIEIVQVEDALAYKPSQPFDYLFADIHHDATDGLMTYLRYLRLENFAKESDFWIEKAVLEFFRRHVITLVYEEMDGYKDKEYQNPSTDSEKVLSALHFHLKNFELSSLEGLYDLLSDERLREIAKSMKIDL